jgi:hypothetical protein
VDRGSGFGVLAVLVTRHVGEFGDLARRLRCAEKPCREAGHVDDRAFALAVGRGDVALEDLGVFELDAELFPDLPAHGVPRGLAGLDLAAGEVEGLLVA